MSERVCTVCHEHHRGVLFVAAEAGMVVASADDDPHEGHEVQAGDVVCMWHTATTPAGRYVRLEDGG